MLTPTNNDKKITKILRIGIIFYGLGMILTLIGLLSGGDSGATNLWTIAGLAVMAVYGIFSFISISVLTSRDQENRINKN